MKRCGTNPLHPFSLAVGHSHDLWRPRTLPHELFCHVQKMASVIGLYMLALDDEFGAEVYSGATSEYQAMEVFRPALLMARITPKFLQRYGVSANASNLAVVEKNSK